MSKFSKFSKFIINIVTDHYYLNNVIATHSFDSESCPADESELPEFTSLENFELETVANLRYV